MGPPKLSYIKEKQNKGKKKEHDCNAGLWVSFVIFGIEVWLFVYLSTVEYKKKEEKVQWTHFIKSACSSSILGLGVIMDLCTSQIQKSMMGFKIDKLLDSKEEGK